MENNKWYLKKIQCVFLVALFYGLVNAYSPQIATLFHISFEKTFFIARATEATCFFFCLALITGKWKQALMALTASLAITIGMYLFSPPAFTLTKFIASLLLSPLPLVLFLILVTKWSNRIITAYFLFIVINSIFTLSYYAPEGIRRAINTMFHYSEILSHLITVVLSIAMFIFSILVFGELFNFLLGKNYGRKSNVINLGNEYEKLNGLIVFWTLKVVFLVIVSGGAFYIVFHRQFMSDYNYYSLSRPDVSFLTMRVSGIFTIITAIPATLLYAWYLRKFLLEYFITFEIKSKFLYWLSAIPFIGLFSFLVLQIENNSQKEYEKKVTALSDFAASSTTGITVFFLLLYFIRLISRISGGEYAFILSLAISLLLFYWLISYKNAYNFNLWLNVILLTLSAFALLLINWEGESLTLIFVLLLFNVIFLVLIYPVYHFEQFEYIPANLVTEEAGEPLVSE